VWGGEPENAKQNGPGEWTAAAIKGGQECHRTQRDMIAVPVRMTQWWKPVRPRAVAYFALFHSCPAHDQPQQL
jgi:hypothetical protein